MKYLIIVIIRISSSFQYRNNIIVTLSTQSMVIEYHVNVYRRCVTSIRNEELILIILKSHVCCILIKLRRVFYFQNNRYADFIIDYGWSLSFSLNGGGKSISALCLLWLILMMQKPEMQAIRLRRNEKSGERNRCSTITMREGGRSFLLPDAAVTKNEVHSVRHRLQQRLSNFSTSLSL